MGNKTSNKNQEKNSNPIPLFFAQNVNKMERNHYMRIITSSKLVIKDFDTVMALTKKFLQDLEDKELINGYAIHNTRYVVIKKINTLILTKYTSNIIKTLEYIHR